MSTKRTTFIITLLFWALCAIIFVKDGGRRTISLRPQSVHVWRQTDCVSYALNYYQNNQPFFESQTHTQTGKDGHTVSEFPIIYYIAGKLYHIFGPNEAIIRAINFAVFLFGCTCLLWLGIGVLENKWLALIPALITFTSPYLFYYGLNFLPDVPALSFAIAGCFLAFRYFKTRKLSLAYLASAAFCLAMLLKISAGISLVALAGAVLLSSETRKSLSRKHKIHLTVLFLIISIINFAWIEFAKYYNHINGTGQNLLGLFPIWDASPDEILTIFGRLYKVWLPVILHPLAWLWMGFLLCGCIWKRESLNPLMRWFLLLNITGAITYSLLWFRAYKDHDYYMINPFIAIVCIMICACIIIDKARPAVKKGFALIFLLVFIFSFYQSCTVQWKRYNDPEYIFVNPDYFTAEPYLRSIGISRHDLVVSVPDNSPNITLYFLNQPGWTEAFNSEYNNIDLFVTKGAKYLMISDTSYTHKELYIRHMGALVGQYKSISIYRIR